MEIIKEIEFRRRLNYSSFTSFNIKIKLIKLEKEYCWWFIAPSIHFDYIRYNGIIRPLKTSYINGSTFRFFEKDLANNSESVAYLQDDVD